MGRAAYLAVGIAAMLAFADTSFATEPSPWVIEECRTRGACTWITGKLIPPGSAETSVANMCERIDPLSGSVVDVWPATSRLHIFWNSNILNSGWFLRCER